MFRYLFIILMLFPSLCLAETDSSAYHELYSPFFITNNHLMDKIVNDHGNGYDTLYGVRNLRVVLHGYMYRGGANNSYNKYNKKSNSNPLQQMALDNLCKEGFSSAVYLYTTNFKSYHTSCINRWGDPQSFDYIQISPFSQSGIKSVLTKVYDSITGKIIGPVYTHCWNGWHASGLVSALSLRQWCGFTGDEAVQYWVDGTDSPGNSNYPEHKATIKAYKVDPSMPIDDILKDKICPTNIYHKE